MSSRCNLASAVRAAAAPVSRGVKMTSKRTRIGRPTTSARQLRAWNGCFRWGADYFCDATREFGYPSPTHIPRKDIAAAWRVLGRDYMARWEPEPHRAWPRALLEFGPPS